VTYTETIIGNIFRKSGFIWWIIQIFTTGIFDAFCGIILELLVLLNPLLGIPIVLVIAVFIYFSKIDPR